MRKPRYCLDCHSRYFDTGKKASGHIPFRDRASQSSMRRPADKEAVVSQDEPEEEPIVETQRDSGEALPELPLLDEDEEEEDARDDAGDPLADEESPDPVDTKWPSLEEYKVKWASLLEQHSRPNAGGFSRNNLVPDRSVGSTDACFLLSGRGASQRAPPPHAQGESGASVCFLFPIGANPAALARLPVRSLRRFEER